jgi:hypothetical protein
LQGLGMENVGIFYVHLNILRPFGIFYGHLNILRPFGIFYGHLVILWSFGIFSPVLVYCTKRNLATLVDIAFALGTEDPGSNPAGV